jgi:hypothetical protein
VPAGVYSHDFAGFWDAIHTVVHWKNASYSQEDFAVVRAIDRAYKAQVRLNAFLDRSE